MFSIRNNSLPVGFQDMFTLNNQIYSYNTRSGEIFRVPHTRTRLRQFPIKHQDPTIFKVTVQFETEGNGQNEFVSHMDRSEVKL